MDPLIKRRVFLNSAEEAAYDREQLERQEGETHGDILPLEVEDNGQVGWALPQFMRDMQGSVELPKQALQGYEYDEDDIAQFALDFGIAGGAARVAQGTAIDPNTASMFVGPKAKDANLPQLARAKIMEANGVDRGVIKSETGWWKMPGGKWSWEISDENLDISHNAKIEFQRRMEIEEQNPANPPSIGFQGKTKSMLKHEKLFEQYPEIAEDTTSLNFFNPDPQKRINPNVTFGGEFDPNINRLEATATTPDQLLNTVSHELQHRVSNIEGWEPGANQEVAQNFLSSIVDQMPPEWVTRNNLLKDAEDLADEIEWIEKDLLFQDDPFLIEDMRGMVTRKQIEFDELTNLVKDYNKLLEPYDNAYKDFMEKYGRAGGYESDVFGAYRKNEGEALANITARRREYTEGQRAEAPPWEEFGHPGAGDDSNVMIPWEEDVWTEKK